MVTKTEETSAGTAYGKKLDVPIPFKFSWEEYENTDEMVAAKDEMTLKEQMKARNAQAKQSARTKAQNAEFESRGMEKPNLDNDEQFRLKEMFKILKSIKAPDGSPRYTDEQARDVAAQQTGSTWAEE